MRHLTSSHIHNSLSDQHIDLDQYEFGTLVNVYLDIISSDKCYKKLFNNIIIFITFYFSYYLQNMNKKEVALTSEQQRDLQTDRLF